MCNCEEQHKGIPCSTHGCHCHEEEERREALVEAYVSTVLLVPSGENFADTKMWLEKMLSEALGNLEKLRTKIEVTDSHGRETTIMDEKGTHARADRVESDTYSYTGDGNWLYTVKKTAPR